MNEDQKLKDQFDILFDELQETEEKAETAMAEAAEAAEKALAEVSEDLDAAEKAADLVDDTDIRDEFEEIDFDDLNKVIAGNSAEDVIEEVIPAAEEISEAVLTAEEAAEEAPVFAPLEGMEEEDPVTEEVQEEEEVFEEIAEAEEMAEVSDEEEASEETEEPAAVPVKTASPEPTIEQLRRERRTFWTFTAVVGVLVAAAVLFILYSRGIIFNDARPTETTPVIITTDSKETSSNTTEALPTYENSEESTSEEVSSEEDTTEEITSDEASSEESVSEDTSSEEAAGEETPVESQPVDAPSVLDNYVNPFVVSGTEMVNVRAAASTDADIIAKIPENGGGELIDVADGWAHIVSGSYDGYVSADFIKVGDEAKALMPAAAIQAVKVTADSLNMRAAASTDADILEPVVKGTVWPLENTADGFYQVTYMNGVSGFLSSEFSAAGLYLQEASARYN